jgi:hypothetical protein
MTDDERMDLLLRRAMSAGPPEPPSDFDARLARRLRARGLGRTGRLLLAAYALVALGVTVWVMRGASLDWTLVAAAVAPVAIAAAMYRWRLGTHAR